MRDFEQDLKREAEKILGEVRRRLPLQDQPFLVAVDGGSGSGKSTVAALIAKALNAALVPGDDFFSAHITDEEWHGRTAQQRAADAIHWQRLRTEVLEPLLQGQPARWNAFDFVSGVRADGTYGMLSEVIEIAPARVIVLDGTYSARPELLDLIDLSVLVDVPVAVRHQRLSAREDKEFLDAWHARWDEAEAHYFTDVRPPTSFDLVVTNGSANAAASGPTALISAGREP